MTMTYIVEEVEDTGVGLAKETQDRYLTNSFQVSPGGSVSSQGLGWDWPFAKKSSLPTVEPSVQSPRPWTWHHDLLYSSARRSRDCAFAD